MINKILLLWVFLSFTLNSFAITNSPFEQQLKNGLKKNIISKKLQQKRLSKAETQSAINVLYKYYRHKEYKKYLSQWKNKKIIIDGKTMKFTAKIPNNYRQKSLPLYISLHGGGGTAAKVNDQQWANQQNLYQVKDAIYVAPRAPTDAWDMWHKGHIDKFFAELIKGAILCYNADPDKIYILGYSAGGDGVFQLAPRMADYWAGAAMMAGHPGDASAMNLLNTYFSIYMGGKDKAYDRNKHATTWDKQLRKLTKKYPNYYKNDVEIYKKMGHWMNRKDAIAIKRLAKNKRDSYPKMIFWRQDNVLHERFYWLAIPKGSGIVGSEIKVVIRGQSIIIKEVKKIKKLIIRLNDDLINLDLPIQIVYKSKRLFSGRVSRKINIIAKTLKERYDKKGVYSCEIKVTLP